MRAMWLCLTLIPLVNNCASLSQYIEVDTPLGKILGSTLTSRLGETIYAFRGIRYAKAPINDFRFKPPVPVESWPGTYNATEDGPACPQPTDDPVSEDCLVLNVYTTKVLGPKQPVIVYLHAGGFYSGTGRSDWTGPQYFLDQDIVLVTLNYRLGSLGFLSIDEEVPGNNGLKDQVVALKWVKSNIESFGGDPNSVTLFGYSAGSWSITLHLVSPMSKGLFHKAILGSGAYYGPIPIPKNQTDLAKKQARIVGCPDEDLKRILECLKTKPAEELGNSLPQFAEFGYDPVAIWSPVIEDFGEERFLTDDPVKLIEGGNFEQVPIVAGVTKDEFANRAFPLVANKSLLGELDNNFEKYAPICFCYERDTNKSRNVSRSIRQFYLNNETLNNASLTGLTKIYADTITGFSINKAVKLLSQKSLEPVYYYEFTYQGRFSHFYLPETNNSIPYGVVHHDDLIYLFYIEPLFPFFNSSFPESEMVERLTSLWANFAKTGIPTSSNSEKLNESEWLPYDVCSKKYMDIGKRFVLKENLFEERYNFWEKLYPVFSP